MRIRLSLFAALLLSGCATLTEPVQQTVHVQTIQDNREIAGVGCILSNQAGRWFVTTPGRVTLQKSFGDLIVDCRKGEDVFGRELVASKENATLWGNIVLSAGLGYYVDKRSGAGFDYPETLTIIMRKNGPASAPASTGSKGQAVF